MTTRTKPLVGGGGTAENREKKGIWPRHKGPDFAWPLPENADIKSLSWTTYPYPAGSPYISQPLLPILHFKLQSKTCIA